MRFQQIAAPIMAKGIEDTAFYVYNRFVSLNEIGGSPDRFGTPLEILHGQNIERMKFWPHALIATSTHDTKRSEDVRARLSVLSEIPAQWQERIRKWSRLNKRSRITVDGRIAPDRNEEYLLYQTLIGSWPVGRMENPEYEAFKKRIKDYMLKAMREAKVNTSWISTDTVYEDAIMTFLETTMKNTSDNQFLQDFLSFQKIISYCGMYNSLSMTLLKITCPGVPDFYQGTEIWDFSLVDPDNRRPVDYQKRIKMLEELKNRESEVSLTELTRELTVNKEDGKIKLYLIYKALNYRKTKRVLFEEGEYIPLESMGEKAYHVCAFARRFGDSVTLIAVPRFLTKLIQQPETFPFGKEVWRDSFMVIPFEDAGARYRNVFTGEIISIESHKGAIALFLSDIFMNFPVALMEKIS